MAVPAHSTPVPRRHFLRHLAALPLIGGSLALIGQPTASAVEVTNDLLYGYKAWLHFEHRMLSYELAGYDIDLGHEVERIQKSSGLPAERWHFQWARHGSRGPAGWLDAPQPSSRAAVILSAAGVPLR